MELKKVFSKLQFFALAVVLSFTTLLVKAQDKAADLKIDVDVDKGGDAPADWMNNPMIWVAGAVVVIILFALIARGGNRK